MDITTLTISLPNAAGLHARPCHAIVATALEYECELRIRFDGRDVDGKSILELMTLAAPQGSNLELVARGADSGVCMERLEALIRSGFGESS
jgi:phosphotransferase system HPr (HPr) family protein